MHWSVQVQKLLTTNPRNLLLLDYWMMMIMMMMLLCSSLQSYFSQSWVHIEDDQGRDRLDVCIFHDTFLTQDIFLWWRHSQTWKLYNSGIEDSPINSIYETVFLHLRGGDKKKSTFYGKPLLLHDIQDCVNLIPWFQQWDWLKIGWKFSKKL